MVVAYAARMDQRSPAPTDRGHCFCGAVQFDLRGDPRLVGYCHCTDCRRAQASGAVAWACYRDEQVELTSGAAGLIRYTSANGSVRSFCGVCGTTMFFVGLRWPGEVHVALGALADDYPHHPEEHAYADRAPAWDPIHDRLPQLGGADGSTPL